jgi:hypothetical protein
MRAYRPLEKLVVYQTICCLHVPESDRHWPKSLVREGGDYDGDRALGFLEP